MKIQLSDHFTYKRLIRFVFPSIIMMICTSMYSIIDGLFISNFAGKTAFAAVNLILPVAMGVGAIGICVYLWTYYVCITANVYDADDLL